MFIDEKTADLVPIEVLNQILLNHSQNKLLAKILLLRPIHNLTETSYLLFSDIEISSFTPQFITTSLFEWLKSSCNDGNLT